MLLGECRRTVALSLALLMVVGMAGCGKTPGPVSSADPFDIPIAGATAVQVLAFDEGDRLFGLELRDHDGLGPLYTRQSCDACHNEGTRGPGFVQKMAVVEGDGITPAPDQGRLAFGNTVHPLVTAGAHTPIVAPGDFDVKVSTRMGPPVLGRGYLEAVGDEEIVRVAATQAARSDGIHGRVNHVVYTSQPNPETIFHTHVPGDLVIGRFGLKARIATLDDFTADALRNDMGLTSPLRPTEFPNPDQLTDDLKPGVDLTANSVNQRANYLRMIAIPRRPDLASAPGRELFDTALCSACHVPALRTRADYPIVLLANIDAPIFTDLLLHDMGDTLADGQEGNDGEAGPRDWRTAPLIGLRFNRTFLHDGRATSIRDAVLGHAGSGSEANGAVMAFQGLAPDQQEALLEFVEGL